MKCVIMLAKESFFRAFETLKFEKILSPNHGGR